MDKKIIMSRDIIFNKSMVMESEYSAQEEKKKQANIYLKIKESITNSYNDICGDWRPLQISQTMKQVKIQILEIYNIKMRM